MIAMANGMVNALVNEVSALIGMVDVMPLNAKGAVNESCLGG